MKIFRSVIFTIFAVPFFASCSNSAPVNYKVSVQNTNGVTVTPETVKAGDSYEGKIEINTTMLPKSFLPKTLTNVTSGSKELSSNEYTYTLSQNKLSADFTIPAENISGDINIELNLDTPDDKDFLCITCNEGGGPLAYGLLMDSPTPPKTLYKSFTFSTTSLNLEYSKDKIEWFPAETLGDNFQAKICDIEKGESVYLRGDNPNGLVMAYGEAEIRLSFLTPGLLAKEYKKAADLIISGNPMSILDKSNFENITELTSDGCLSRLFFGNCDVVDASKLHFTATKVSAECFEAMFRSCDNLIKGPEILSATTLGRSCYKEMFHSCKNLLNAPILPASKLAYNCYDMMFFNCITIDYLEVGFGEPGEAVWPVDEEGNSCTDSWLWMPMDGAAPNGTFVWNGSTDTNELEANGLFDDEDYIPTGWNVKNPESNL